MSPRPLPTLRPRLLPVILSLVPGLGHWLLGRSRRGLLFFLAASGAWNLAALSLAAPVFPLGSWSLKLGLALALAITAGALVDTFVLSVAARLPAARSYRQRHLREGIALYLQHDFQKARDRFQVLLQKDPADPLASLYLATLERRQGHVLRALKHARQALAVNPRNPFYPELEREIALALESRHGS